MEKKIVEVPSELKDLIPGFMQNRKNDVVELKSLIANKNFDAISKIAHKIKGSAGGYGFDELTEVAATLEQNAKNNNLSDVEKNMQEIINIVEHAEIKYVD